MTLGMSRSVEEGEPSRGLSSPAMNRRGLSPPTSVDLLEVKDYINNTNIEASFGYRSLIMNLSRRARTKNKSEGRKPLLYS